MLLRPCRDVQHELTSAVGLFRQRYGFFPIIVPTNISSHPTFNQIVGSGESGKSDEARAGRQMTWQLTAAGLSVLSSWTDRAMRSRTGLPLAANSVIESAVIDRHEDLETPSVRRSRHVV